MTFRRMLMVISGIFAAVLMILAGVLFWKSDVPAEKNLQKEEFSQALSSVEEPIAEQPQGPHIFKVRFSASGDNLIHEGIYKQAARRAVQENSGKSYDFLFCYDNLRDFYRNYDVNWINQETLVNDGCPPSTYPCFSTPGQMAWDLYDFGFRVFSLSNNHTYDQGTTGLEATRKLWASMPEDVVTSGIYDLSEENQISYQEINNIAIAYLSYTEHTNGIPLPAGADCGVIYLDDSAAIAKQIQTARRNADFVVVSCHWGTEGSHTVNDFQRKKAQEIANLGADVILGTHPHVVQDAAWLDSDNGRKTFVVYSLGNFISMQDSADNLIGTILDVTLQKTVQPDGTVQTEILSPVLFPVVTHYDWNYANDRIYLLSDYTEELAATHGAHEYNSVFSLDYLQQVIQTNISPEFLAA